MEEKVDADYSSCFPSSVGWESAALHLLLVYDSCARSQGLQVVDTLKYALMHALRWGKDARSQPFKKYPCRLDKDLIESSKTLLRRGSEYTGICGGFTSYRNDIVEIERLEDSRIEFTANAAWKAYDVLDEQLAASSTGRHNRLVHEVRQVATSLANQFVADGFSGLEGWFPDFRSARRLIGPVNGLLQPSFRLPQTWTFDGIPILHFRHFWRAVALLSWIHSAVAHQLTGSQDTGFFQLVICQKEDLASWISGVVGVQEGVVFRLLDLHTYDRSHKRPDIALTPFLPIGGGLIAASPWMLLSSAMERNFCAFAACQHGDLYSPASKCLAPAMANQLAVEFMQAGFRATHSISFTTNKEKGDIDLLVWSPQEQHVLAAELKWLIATADFKEVLNRGEKTCKDAIQRQLPKYSACLSNDAAGIVRRAFRLETSPRIKEWSCGLLVRGFVGSPRVQGNDYYVLPEELAAQKIREQRSLRELCEWAKTKPYLPVENRDFRMCPIEVTSPSGIVVRFWEWELIDHDR